MKKYQTLIKCVQIDRNLGQAMPGYDAMLGLGSAHGEDVGRWI